MAEKSPKRPVSDAQPMGRTLSSAENDFGRCTGTTRDRMEELLASEEVLPSISSNLGIEDELMDAFEQNSQDSLELAKAREDYKKEELAATRLEVSNLENKILNDLESFKILEMKREAALKAYVESKKKIRNGKSSEQDREGYLNSVKNAKGAVRQLEQFRLEFDMSMKQLQTINKRSKVLQSPEVKRLVEHFQEMIK